MLEIKSLIALLILLAACGSAPITGFREVGDPELVPTQCPDFSGTYFYPGSEHHGEVCTSLTRFEVSKLFLPMDHGYWDIGSDSTLAIHQIGCIRLEIVFTEEVIYGEERAQSLVPGGGAPGRKHFELLQPAPDGGRVVKFWRQFNVDLTPGRKHAEVRWGEDSVYLRYRYTGKGFGAGTTRLFTSMWLQKRLDGGLLYRIRKQETLFRTPPHDGIGELDLECVLAPVAPEDDRGG